MISKSLVGVVWIGFVGVPILALLFPEFSALVGKAHANVWVAIFTFLLAVITCFLAYVTYLQVRTTRASQRAYVSVNPGGIRLLDGVWQVLGHVVF